MSKETISDLVARAVRKLLAHAGVSHRQAEPMTGVSHRSIGRIINQEVSPSVAAIEQIANGFGVPAWSLLHPQIKGDPEVARMADSALKQILGLEGESLEYVLTTIQREALRTPAVVPDLSELGLTPLDEDGRPIGFDQFGSTGKK